MVVFNSEAIQVLRDYMLINKGIIYLMVVCFISFEIAKTFIIKSRKGTMLEDTTILKRKKVYRILGIIFSIATVLIALFLFVNLTMGRMSEMYINAVIKAGVENGIQ